MKSEHHGEHLPQKIYRVILQSDAPLENVVMDGRLPPRFCFKLE
jgi:hypothetical protein